MFTTFRNDTEGLLYCIVQEDRDGRYTFLNKARGRFTYGREGATTFTKEEAEIEFDSRKIAGQTGLYILPQNDFA